MAKAKSPRKQQLKVFRIAIGFHDAYVAAPSRKAALEAWGSSGDLFSQGAAEVVTDPELMREPLARPGEVVRVSRGSADEQVRALGKTTKKKKEGGSRIKSGMTKEVSRRGRKPSRGAVDKAEQAVARAKARLREASDKLRDEELALEEARKRYRAAMAAWADA